VAAFASVHPGPVVTFGFSPGSAVRAEGLRRTGCGTRFEIPGEGVFDTVLEGRHAVLNILAGVAVARLFGIPAGELREAIRTIEASPMRGRRMEHHGIQIIDDCYNANPDAVRAMLETLRDAPGRRHIAVLGEMLELGRRTEALHQEIGRYLAACGVDVLVGIRGAARQLADAAVAGGLPLSAAYFFPEPEEAGDCLAQLARPGDVILFKGSRGSRVERALERFLSHGSAAAGALAETGGGNAGSAARGTGPAGEAL
jgi:UDP-N-acetylmuramoyl-tripeptide--D-alanyl-D-alanine ligase